MNKDNYDPRKGFEALRRGFENREGRTLEARVALLEALDRILTKREQDLESALRRDLGKPPIESYLSETYFVRNELRLICKNLARWSKPKRRRSPFFFQPASSWVSREPFGVSLVAAPWNYPFQLSMSPVIGSLAAGNSVMLKPSELAPATANFLAEVAHELDSPERFQVVLGGPEVGSACLELPFDHFFYTGSERVGRLYGEAAARHLSPSVLELGGKCPAILHHDAPVAETAKRIVRQKFFNAGQTCMAPDYVVVPEQLHESFVNKLTDHLRESYPDLTDLGRIVSHEHYTRLETLIEEEAKSIGQDEPEGLQLAPRLLPNAGWDIPAMQGEIFGPILPVISYTDLSDTIARVKSHGSPLALYLFSRDRAWAEGIAAEVPSGGICFNDVMKQGINLDLPFGGVG
ncbi:MAG: aldehyde dehydrogenase family protein, partial [Verrucomicrobiota bacterium]